MRSKRLRAIGIVLALASVALLAGWVSALVAVNRFVDRPGGSPHESFELVTTREHFEQLSALNIAATWLLPLGLVVLLAAAAVLAFWIRELRRPEAPQP